MIMSRLGFCAYAALTCATLVFASGMAPQSASAGECGRGYRTCNGSCEQPVQSDTKVLVCKNRCDLSLIACDKRPISPFTEGDSYFIKARSAIATASIAGE
jgi:hypothetical protein